MGPDTPQGSRKTEGDTPLPSGKIRPILPWDRYRRGPCHEASGEIVPHESKKIVNIIN
jgi:hypothetical protein